MLYEVITLAQHDRLRGAADRRAAEDLQLDVRLVVPGFIESHGHFLALGERNNFV